MGTLKGQNLRILVFDHTETPEGEGATPYDVFKVIGMATSCTITLNNNLDNASHKDIVGMAPMPQVMSGTSRVIERGRYSSYADCYQEYAADDADVG